MTQTTKLSHGIAHPATPQSVAPDSKAAKYATNPGGVAMGLTLNMAWQLAAVVLLPLLGGHYLDDQMNTAPAWTVVGLVLAMIAMILVVRRTLVELNKHITASLPTPEQDKDKN